jgi:LSD1 subclass zinc finger protein
LRPYALAEPRGLLAALPPQQQRLVTVTCGTCRSTLQRPPGEGAVLCGVCGSFVRA